LLLLLPLLRDARECLRLELVPRGAHDLAADSAQALHALASAHGLRQRIDLPQLRSQHAAEGLCFPVAVPASSAHTIMSASQPANRSINQLNQQPRQSRYGVASGSEVAAGG